MDGMTFDAIPTLTIALSHAQDWVGVLAVPLGLALGLGLVSALTTVILRLMGRG